MPIQPIKRYATENKLHLVDAKTAVEVEVTASDAKNGNRLQPQSCGLAVACHRQFRNIVAAHFFRTTAYLEYKSGKLVRYRLPPSVQTEIKIFDKGAKMSPGLYRLIPPAPADTLPALKKRPSIKKKRTRLPGTKGLKAVVHRRQLRATDVRHAVFPKKAK